MHAVSSQRMSIFMKGAAFVAIFILAILAIGWSIKKGFGAGKQLDFAIWASVFMAVVTPVAVIMIRHEVRLSRIKLIELFADTFNFAAPSQQAGPVQLVDPRGAQNVSFEFVKGKYFADLDLPPNQSQTAAAVPKFPMLIRSDWLMLICAIPFIVIAWFGAFILFAPLIEVMRIGKEFAVGSWLWPSMLALGGSDNRTLQDAVQFEAQHVNVLTVAMLAFAGGYFFSLRLLLRAVAVFDLSPVTFLRCFVHILLAMLLAVVIYRVFPSGETVGQAVSRTGQALQMIAGSAPPPTQSSKPAGADEAQRAQKVEAPPPDAAGAAAAPGACPSAQACPSTGAAAGVSVVWLILAFALGFIPDAALQYVLQKSGLTFKERYGDLDPHAKLVPVTVIEGVDNFIAYRLEEANIFDVQNLATANPIMLHIESPFGIYETIDWVAQAQLCTVAGPDRFLMLKTLNIRTIFDLERAVMKPVREAPVETLIDRAAAAAAQATKASAYADATRLSLDGAKEALAIAEKAATGPDDPVIQKAKATMEVAHGIAGKAAKAEQEAVKLATAAALAVRKSVEAAFALSAIDPATAGRLVTLNLAQPPADGIVAKPPLETPLADPPLRAAGQDAGVVQENRPPDAATIPGEAQSTKTAESGADIIMIIGEVLLSDNQRDTRMRTALGLGGPAHGGRSTPSVETVRHMVMVMLDDLHVHRLRQVWKHIARQLGDANGHL